MKTNRRNFFQTLGRGTAGLSFASILPASACANTAKENNSEDDQALYIGDDIAVTETVYGKVRGFIQNGNYHFRGIPYGADTSGKNRFMPPQKPDPWDDIFPAIWWGNSAPQNMDNRYADVHSAFRDCWNYDDVSEDCLKLNVWTPALADGAKRPVMVWLHGGGFTNGNAIEQDGYKGENLSRKADIVFVSINHRLGPIGFSDLSAAGGNKYADSGNVGALDMLAALEWVRDNISNFGGDPGNVTIMGQSGGGSKVCTLAAMPAAKGLFHKMVPLSGSSIEAGNQESSQKLGEYVLDEAGLKSSEIDKLQEMPWKEYLELANSAYRKFARENEVVGRGGFRPVADGKNIIKGKFFNDPDGLSSDVPMIICSTFHEGSLSKNNPELEEITEEEVKERLGTGAGLRSGPLGENASEVYDAYKSAFPNAKPIELLNMISSNRKRVLT